MHAMSIQSITTSIRTCSKSIIASIFKKFRKDKAVATSVSPAKDTPKVPVETTSNGAE